MHQLYGIYLLTDEYMQNYYPSYYPNEHGGLKRPFVLIDKEPNGVYWMAPMSSKLDKYQELFSRYPHSGMMITTPNGRTSAILMSDVVPVLPKYVRDAYLFNSVPYKIVKPDMQKELNKKFKKTLHMIDQDVIRQSVDIRNLYFTMNRMASVKSVDEHIEDANRASSVKHAQGDESLKEKAIEKTNYR